MARRAPRPRHRRESRNRGGDRGGNRGGRGTRGDGRARRRFAGGGGAADPRRRRRGDDGADRREQRRGDRAAVCHRRRCRTADGARVRCRRADAVSVRGHHAGAMGAHARNQPHGVVSLLPFGLPRDVPSRRRADRQHRIAIGHLRDREVPRARRVQHSPSTASSGSPRRLPPRARGRASARSA